MQIVIIISIHALLAESDHKYHTGHTVTVCISIHALLAESDNLFRFERVKLKLFLSTLSLRRATVHLLAAGRKAVISIHALLAESDVVCARFNQFKHKFLSTLSLRRATRQSCTRPRRPLFLSTLSLRRATLPRQLHSQSGGISIHALLAESDGNSNMLRKVLLHFYPRSPCGERPWQSRCPEPKALYFYPRSPCGERPQNRSILIPRWPISIHALLAESDKNISALCRA